jgi:hypothetical protein
MRECAYLTCYLLPATCYLYLYLYLFAVGADIYKQYVALDVAMEVEVEA